MTMPHPSPALDYEPRPPRKRRVWRILFGALIIVSAIVLARSGRQWSRRAAQMWQLRVQQRKVQACMDYVAAKGQVIWDDSVSPPVAAPAPAAWKNFWGKSW